MAWVNPITWIAGVTPGNATNMNTIRDSLNVIGDSWATYTPTWTATTTPPTLGASTVTGSYRLTGKTADIHINAFVGAGFAPGSGLYRFTLPPGATALRPTTHDAVGACVAWDTSAGSAYPLTVFQVTSTTVACVSAAPAGMAPGVPFVWATGDTISIHIIGLELA